MGSSSKFTNHPVRQRSVVRDSALPIFASARPAQWPLKTSYAYDFGLYTTPFFCTIQSRHVWLTGVSLNSGKVYITFSFQSSPHLPYRMRVWLANRRMPSQPCMVFLSITRMVKCRLLVMQFVNYTVHAGSCRYSQTNNWCLIGWHQRHRRGVNKVESDGVWSRSVSTPSCEPRMKAWLWVSPPWRLLM